MTAQPTLLLEKLHRFPVKTQYVLINERQRMTHVWSILKIGFILCEEMNVFTNALICV
jgi:hypothetical protein